MKRIEKKLAAVSRKYFVFAGLVLTLFLLSASEGKVWAAEMEGQTKEETAADGETGEPSEEVKSGWDRNGQNGKVCYYVEGKLQTGWQRIDGKKYYFSPKNGEMLTGKQKIGKAVYFFRTGGAQRTGWVKIKGKKYYFSTKSGKMLTGRQKIRKKAYYFNKKGIMQTGGWLKIGKKTYYCNKNGVLQAGWLAKNGKKYYFSPKSNVMQTGWVKVGSYKYYLASSGAEMGVLQAGGIVGSSKEGFFYTGADGRQVASSEVIQAVAFVKAHTSDSWTSDVKLQKCFEYLWKNYSYQRFYETPTAASMPGYANDMLASGKGNCYRYAASFAYIAKVLGYDSRVAVGSISSLRGGMTPHGWTEVKLGNTWYMCDANMQRNYPNINSYMRTEANYAYRHTCSVRYTLTIQNGGVSWQ